MHYRQTILEAALTTLAGATLLQKVTASDFYADPVTPAAWVQMGEETLPDDQRDMRSQHERRVLNLVVLVKVQDPEAVQAVLNSVLEEVEGLLPAGLEPVADCAWLERVGFDTEATQDKETALATLEYAVHYSTVLGDPSQRAT